MNRLIFSQGGQPVYLDDLQTLQDNGIADMATLMSALTDGIDTFLLRPITLSKKDNSDTTVTTGSASTTTAIYTVKEGAAMVKGQLVSWPAVEMTLASSNTPLYLCIKRTNTDNRNFEDGQSRPCAIATEAWIATDKTGVSEAYLSSQLPNLPRLLRTTLSIADDPTYRQLDVTFKNGYSGKVMVKELADAYRYLIDIKSAKIATLTGNVDLFFLNESLPGTLYENAFVSPVKAYYMDENSAKAFSISAHEGNVQADVSLAEEDQMGAADIPVKMIFELPK